MDTPVGTGSVAAAVAELEPMTTPTMAPWPDWAMIAVLVSDPEARRAEHRRGNGLPAQLTTGGPVEIEVPRDRARTFEPAVVMDRQRGSGSIEDIVLWLSARWMTHAGTSAHLAEISGSEASKATISAITGEILDGMGESRGRTLTVGPGPRSSATAGYTSRPPTDRRCRPCVAR